MKRVLVWCGASFTYDRLCRTCRKRLDDSRAGDPSQFISIEVVPMYFSIAADKYHIFEVVKVARPWQSWRVYGQPLCGRAVSRTGSPPYEILWLPRLFQHIQPKHHQALRATLSMLALAGNQ